MGDLYADLGDMGPPFFGPDVALSAGFAGDVQIIFYGKQGTVPLSLSDGSWTEMWNDNITGTTPPLALNTGWGAAWWRMLTTNVSHGAAGPTISPAPHIDATAPWDSGAGFCVTFVLVDATTFTRVGWQLTDVPVVVGGADSFGGANGQPIFSFPGVEWDLDVPALDVGTNIGDHLWGVMTHVMASSVGIHTFGTDTDIPDGMINPNYAFSVENSGSGGSAYDGITTALFVTPRFDMGGPQDVSVFDPGQQEYSQHDINYSTDGNFTFHGWSPPGLSRVFAVLGGRTTLAYWGINATTPF